MAADLLVCVATDLESALLQSAGVAVLKTGLGPVNAAWALTRALESETPERILVCGVGGAYPGSGLEIGTVASASTECYGDLGAETSEGFRDLEALGFPLIEGPPRVYNTLPLAFQPVTPAVPFVTCSTCTGSLERARDIEARTRGSVESMEGAALVHVATLAGLPIGEVRGISNLVGETDRSKWRVRAAAEAAQTAVLTWLETR